MRSGEFQKVLSFSQNWLVMVAERRFALLDAGRHSGDRTARNSAPADWRPRAGLAKGQQTQDSAERGARAVVSGM